MEHPVNVGFFSRIGKDQETYTNYFVSRRPESSRRRGTRHSSKCGVALQELPGDRSTLSRRPQKSQLMVTCQET